MGVVQVILTAHKEFFNEIDVNLVNRDKIGPSIRRSLA